MAACRDNLQRRVVQRILARSDHFEHVEPIDHRALASHGECVRILPRGVNSRVGIARNERVHDAAAFEAAGAVEVGRIDNFDAAPRVHERHGRRGIEGIEIVRHVIPAHPEPDAMRRLVHPIDEHLAVVALVAVDAAVADRGMPVLACVQMIV